MTLTKYQAAEVVRCYRDPKYFINTYCWIQREASASVLPFKLFPFQENIIDNVLGGTNIVVIKSRRVGWSWAVAGLSAALINFRRGIKILLLSRRESDAIEVLDKCKFILDNLAEHDADNIAQATKVPWLLGEIIVSNKTELTRGFRNENGVVTQRSTIVSLTNTDNSGRGAGAKFVFMDEFAFYDRSWETWRSVSKTTMGGGVWAVGSSPNGIGNKFHQLVMQGRLGQNVDANGKKTFELLEVHWSDSWLSKEDVERDKATADASDADQEWELKFLTTGETAFDATHLANCYKPPDEFPEVAEELKKYRELVLSSKGATVYYSGADSMIGKRSKRSSEKDYNAFIAMTDSGIQAYTYTSQEPIDEWSGYNIDGPDGQRIEVKGTLSKLHAEWPGVLVMEEQGGGVAAYINHILPEDGFSDVEKFQQTQKSKWGAVDRLRLAINTHQIVITDLETYLQLQMYQDRGPGRDRYGAPPGYNDDLVIALLIAHENMLRNGGRPFSWGGDATALKRATDGGDVRNKVDDAMYGPSAVPKEKVVAHRMTDMMPSNMALKSPGMPPVPAPGEFPRST